MVNLQSFNHGARFQVRPRHAKDYLGTCPYSKGCAASFHNAKIKLRKVVSPQRLAHKSPLQWRLSQTLLRRGS